MFGGVYFAQKPFRLTVNCCIANGVDIVIHLCNTEYISAGKPARTKDKAMSPTIWKAYKTESAANKYVIKLNQLGVKDAQVEFVGGLYLVVNCLFKVGA